MTQIDGLSFTQLTNLNIEGELYEHGVPFGGGVTAPLILSTANNPSETPLILRGGGIEDDYDDINSALIFKDAADNEVWRIWGGDPDDSNDNAQNLFIGLNAGELINPSDTLKHNTGVGAFSCQSLTHGLRNSGFGYHSLKVLTTGDDNTGIGSGALDANITGNDNTAVGSGALGAGTLLFGNTAVGRNALADTINGIDNTAVGFGAMSGADTQNNVAIGTVALRFSLGANNTAVGNNALEELLGGTDNAALGFQAGIELTSGNDNTILGAEAADSLSTGSENVIIGKAAGGTLATGSRNIVIGADLSTPAFDTDDYFKLGDLLEGVMSAQGYLIINRMPIAAGSLPSGAIWADNNVLTIIP